MVKHPVAAALTLLALARPAGALEPRATVVVSQDLQPAPHATVERIPAIWKDGVARVTTRDGALDVTLAMVASVGDGDAGDVLTVDARWRKKAWVRRVAVELELDGDGATVVGRDLRPQALPPGKTAYLERFDPKWITLPRSTVLVDDTVDAVIVRRAGKTVELKLDLDAADARPFLYAGHCTTNWRMPNQHLGAPTRLRVPDDKAHARVRFYGTGTVVLTKAHFPDGRRAALSWTDHADQSTARTLEVLVRGFLDHKLAITKALFSHGTDRPQLEDPRVVKLADELAKAGSEVVPHSATPKPDLRDVTSAALDKFERWKTRTWIDHQPETNCEAFGDQGFHVGGKFGIADLLAAHAYQYVWAEVDAPPDDLNLLSQRMDKRAPTVWPIGRLDLGGPDSLWMFRTVWSFLEATRFYRFYGKDRLDKLELQRGLHIAHTYLETYHPKRTKFGLKNLLIPADAHGVAGGPGAVKLDPRFEALLAELEQRQSRGSLWVPTLGALGDRLRGVGELTVTLAADGTARVHAAHAIDGATFVVDDADAIVELDGHKPKGERVDGKQLVFWHDLPAGDTTITMTRGGTAIPFAPPPSPQARR